MKMQYEVLVSNTKSNFMTDVEHALNGGWECVGGVAVLRSSDNEVTYFQAIIKRVEEYVDNRTLPSEGSGSV